MLKLNSFFSITLCARKPGELEQWVEVFARMMGNFTRVNQVGGWVGERVETENNVKMTVWLDQDTAWDSVKPLIDLAESYQAAAEQEAVAIEFKHSGQHEFLVVFAGDWDECRSHLRQAMDLGTYLTDYFSPLNPSVPVVPDDHHDW